MGGATQLRRNASHARERKLLTRLSLRRLGRPKGHLHNILPSAEPKIEVCEVVCGDLYPRYLIFACSSPSVSRLSKKV